MQPDQARPRHGASRHRAAVLWPRIDAALGTDACVDRDRQGAHASPCARTLCCGPFPVARRQGFHGTNDLLVDYNDGAESIERYRLDIVQCTDPSPQVGTFAVHCPPPGAPHTPGRCGRRLCGPAV